jgi:hypothetical protein
VDVARGQHFGEARLGLIVGEANVGEALGLRLQRRAARTAAIHDEHHVAAIDELARRADDEVERLRQADVAGVHDDGLVAHAELAPVGRAPVERRDGLRVDEVGDGTHLLALTGRQLGGDVVAQVVREHRDGVGDAVAELLQTAGRGDDGRVGDGSELDGDVGKDVLDVEHERGAAHLRHPPAG